MTLLKVYNRNGNCSQPEMHSNELSDLMNKYFLNDYNSDRTGIGLPRVNIKDQKETFGIEMEVPGIDKNLLKMNLSKDLLIISYHAEESQSDEKYRLREFTFKNFERTFRIPESVDKENISASYSNGILLVSLPKRDEAIDKGPRNIDIS